MELKVRVLKWSAGLPVAMLNKKTAENIYNELNQTGIETLLDDRDESAGIKFNDAELIGIPFSIVIGDKGLKKGIVEIKIRDTGKIIEIKKEQLKDKILSLLTTQTV